MDNLRAENRNRFKDLHTREEFIDYVKEWYDSPFARAAIIDAFDQGTRLAQTVHGLNQTDKE